MKKVSVSGITVLALIAISTIAFFNSCNSDPCKDVVCLNSGVCNTLGACDCVSGYEGTDCGTETRAKFIGSYTVNDNCSSSGSSSYASTIADGTAATNVNISNFRNMFTNAVIASIDGNTITIGIQEPDATGYTVEGTGTINGTTITWDYTIDGTMAGSGVDICTSTWTM